MIRSALKGILVEEERVIVMGSNPMGAAPVNPLY